MTNNIKADLVLGMVRGPNSKELSMDKARHEATTVLGLMCTMLGSDFKLYLVLEH